MAIRQRKEVAGQPWVYDYKDPATGKRKLATPKSGLKRDAQALKKKIEAEIEAGFHIPLSDSATVSKIIDAYIEDLDQREKDGRIGYSFSRTARGILRNHLVKALGHKRYSDVTVDDVLRFYKKMVDGGNIPSNARDNIRHCSRMEKFAIRRGFIKRPVFKPALGELTGIVSNPIKTFTLEDIRKLLATSAVRRPSAKVMQTARNQAWLHLAVNLAAFCGLRWGEVFGLTLKNVDLDNSILHIRQGLQRGDRAGHYGLGTTTKTPAGRRDIPLPRHIHGLLTEWMAEHFVPNANDLIFTLGADARSGAKGVKAGGGVGLPMRACNFHDHWKRLLIAAGLRDPKAKGSGLHFHALRHFASALMIEHNIPLTDVAGLMGHKNFDMTLQVYAHSIVGGAKRHTAFESMAESVNATNSQLLTLSN